MPRQIKAGYWVIGLAFVLCAIEFSLKLSRPSDGWIIEQLDNPVALRYPGLPFQKTPNSVQTPSNLSILRWRGLPYRRAPESIQFPSKYDGERIQKTCLDKPDDCYIIEIDGRSIASWASLLRTPVFAQGNSVMRVRSYKLFVNGEYFTASVTLSNNPYSFYLNNPHLFWGYILFAVVFIAVAIYTFHRRPIETSARALLFTACCALVYNFCSSYPWQATDFVDPIIFWFDRITTLVSGALSLSGAMVFAWVCLQTRVSRHMGGSLFLLCLMHVSVFAALLWFFASGSRTWFNIWAWVWDQLVTLSLSLTAIVAATFTWSFIAPASKSRWLRMVLPLVVAISPLLLWRWPMMVQARPVWNPNFLLLGVACVLPLSTPLIVNGRLSKIDFTLPILAGFVFVTVFAGGLLLDVDNEPVLALLSVLILVLVYHRIREFLWHRLYGERDNPYTVISRMSQRIEAAYAPNAVLPGIAETLGRSLFLPRVVIELKEGNEFKVVADYKRGLWNIEDTAAGQLSERELPLTYQARIIGRLKLSVWKAEEDEQFEINREPQLDVLIRLTSLAAHAVLLTEDLRRSRERIVITREEERRRLRRDLHDGLGPALSSFVFSLDNARSLLPTDPTSSDAILLKLKERARSTIVDIRRLVYDLRPPSLDDIGLLATIREYVEHCDQLAVSNNPSHQEEPKRLHISVEGPDALPPLSAAEEVAVYRIVQAALENVSQHACASVCVVRLCVHSNLSGCESLEVAIIDDGVGLPTNYRMGVGLNSIRERAEELGGGCEFEARPGGGTSIIAWLPVAKDKALDLA